jgi:hypothetical protein
MVSVNKDNGLFMRAEDPLSPALDSQWASLADLPPTGVRRVGERSPSCSVSLSCGRGSTTDETRRTQRSWLRVSVQRVEVAFTETIRLCQGVLCLKARTRSWCETTQPLPKTDVLVGYRLLYGEQVSPVAVVGLHVLGSSFLRSPGVVRARGFPEREFLVPPILATTTSKNTSAAQGKSAVRKDAGATMAPDSRLPPRLGAGSHKLRDLSGGFRLVKGETLAEKIAGGSEDEDWVGVDVAPTTQRIGASPSGLFRLGTHPGGGQARAVRIFATTAGRTLSLQGPPGCGQRGPVMSWPAVELNVSTGQDVLALDRPSLSLNLESQGGGLMGRGIVETPLLPSTLHGYAVWAHRPRGAYSVGWSDCRRTVPYATSVLARYTEYSRYS